jgi:hypothetical protein
MIRCVVLLVCALSLPLHAQSPVSSSEAGTSRWLETEGRSILRATVVTDDRKTGIRSTEDHEVRRISLQSCVLSWSSAVRTTRKARLMETHDSTAYDSRLRLAELDIRRSAVRDIVAKGAVALVLHLNKDKHIRISKGARTFPADSAVLFARSKADGQRLFASLTRTASACAAAPPGSR